MKEHDLRETVKHLRIEREIMEDDLRGKYDLPVEFLRRRQFKRVSQKIVLLLDEEGSGWALDGYNHFEAGNLGKRISSLKRNP